MNNEYLKIAEEKYKDNPIVISKWLNTETIEQINSKTIHVSDEVWYVLIQAKSINKNKRKLVVLYDGKNDVWAEIKT